MTEQDKQWWEGLGKELEIDIETFDESSSQYNFLLMPRFNF